MRGSCTATAIQVSESNMQTKKTKYSERPPKPKNASKLSDGKNIWFGFLPLYLIPAQCQQ
jgi:hypothetical protein